MTLVKLHFKKIFIFIGFYLMGDPSQVCRIAIIWKQTENPTGLKNQKTEFGAATAAIK